MFIKIKHEQQSQTVNNRIHPDFETHGRHHLKSRTENTSQP